MQDLADMIRWTRDKAPSNVYLDSTLEELLPDSDPRLLEKIHRVTREIVRIMSGKSFRVSGSLAFGFLSGKVQPGDQQSVANSVSMASPGSGSGSGSRPSPLGQYLSNITLSLSHCRKSAASLRPVRVETLADGSETTSGTKLGSRTLQMPWGHVGREDNEKGREQHGQAMSESSSSFWTSADAQRDDLVSLTVDEVREDRQVLSMVHVSLCMMVHLPHFHSRMIQVVPNPITIVTHNQYLFAGYSYSPGPRQCPYENARFRCGCC